MKYKLRLMIEPLVWDIIPQVERLYNHMSGSGKIRDITHLRIRWLCLVILLDKEWVGD